jgi:hypothetical protein
MKPITYSVINFTMAHQKVLLKNALEFTLNILSIKKNFGYSIPPLSVVLLYIPLTSDVPLNDPLKYSCGKQEYPM